MLRKLSPSDLRALIMIMWLEETMWTDSAMADAEERRC